MSDVAERGVDAVVELLRPIEPSVFFRDYWEQKALVIKGSPRKFDWLGLGEPGFAFRLGQLLTPRQIQAGYAGPTGASEQMNEIDPWRMWEYYRAGMTIACSGLEEVSEPLKHLALSVKRYAGHAGPMCVLSFTSPNAGGFGLHFDDQSLFLMQIEGSKRWRYAAAPVVQHPPHNYIPSVPVGETDQETWPWAKIKHPRLEELSECTMEPGDVLYMPAGCWHQGFGIGHSSALTLSCITLRFVPLLLGVLAARLNKEPSWRQNLPKALGAAPADGLPVEVARWMSENISLLKRVVAELSPSDFEPDWRARVDGARGRARTSSGMR